MRLAQIIDHYQSANNDLNEFLEKVPQFRAGFDVSNKSDDKIRQYINESIDPEVHVMKIGVKDMDTTVLWCDTGENISLTYSLVRRYTAVKGETSTKSFVFRIQA